MRKTLCFVWPFVLLLGTVEQLFSSSENTLHNFAGGTDGSDPVADLVYDPTTGIAYGTTNRGGAGPNCTNGCGTVFAINSNGTGYHVVYRFAGGANDGANPQAGLTMDANGNLYGTTFNGGTHNLGTIFILTRTASGGYSESILHSFSGPDGAHPLSRVVFDASGNLIVTTFGGGAHGLGAVFEIQPTGLELVIFSFAGANGSHPRAGVVLDSAGDLWGTTSIGGKFNLGVVFRLTFNGNGWSETFLHNFSGPDGANPYAALTLDTAGDVFGTTKAGGPTCAFATAGCGVAFEFQPSGNEFAEKRIYAFTGGADGAAPIADLTFTMDSAGGSYLYGTASQAGVVGGTCPAVGCGTAFAICSANTYCGGSLPWNESTLFDFVGKNGGRTPAAGMLVFPAVGASLDPWDGPPAGGKAKCTSGCMAPTSSGGTSGNGTVDGFTN
jgi:uncharacterized repeat protein (TIGR03803 family)